MRKKHVGWRELTEDMETLEVRAVRGKALYTIETKLKNTDEWAQVKVTRERLEKLHGILDLRYRRRKGSLKEVELVVKMMSDL